MKNLLVVSVTLLIMACHNGSQSNEAATDSTNVDSTIVPAAPVTSTDTVTNMGGGSTSTRSGATVTDSSVNGTNSTNSMNHTGSLTNGTNMTTKGLPKSDNNINNKSGGKASGNSQGASSSH